MTSKLAALAKIFLLPRRSAPAFVRPLQRILNGAITDEIRTEPQENDDDENEQQKEEQQQQQQQQNKGFLFEALMARRGNLNSNYTKYHQGEGEGVGPIADPIARYQLREVMNEYYRSAINSNNNNNNNSFIFNIQRQDYQDTSSFSSSAASSSSSSPDVAVSRTTPDLSSIPVGDEYLYLAQ